MDHGPAVTHEPDPASGYKTRIGVYLVIIYGLIYAGFVALNTFIPRIMEIRIIFGLNLAVVYGFSLILLAIIMGLIYNRLCSKKEAELEPGGGTEV